jgi:hypothetical protein
MSERTTVEISKQNRNALKEIRLPHESSYDETIERLLGNGEEPYLTEEEVRQIARQEAESAINDRVSPRALE